MLQKKTHTALVMVVLVGRRKLVHMHENADERVDIENENYTLESRTTTISTQRL